MKFAYALVSFLALAAAGCGQINLKCGTLTDCSGNCVNTQTDANNCGACGNACTGGDTCVAGACGGVIGGNPDMACDKTVCGANCVDIDTDVNNCGGCGKVCDTGKSCVGGSCVCVSPNQTCSGVCVDPTSNSANCGMCGMACMGGMTCQQSMCKCPAPQTVCAGQCYDTPTDRAHCGPGCSVCNSAQLCNNGCVPAPAPAIMAKPSDPTGWKDPANQDIVFTFASTGVPGTIHECRTAPDSVFTPAFPAWGPCDGAQGLNPTHKPAPIQAVPEGNYRTEYRYRQDSYVSPVLSHLYYVHHSLDGVPLCPRAGVPGDNPKSTDAAYFTAAQNFATANPTLFPVTGTFAVPSNPPQRSDSTYLRNPFIKITFVGIQHSVGMNFGAGAGTWPAAGQNYVMNELSLRHRYVMNPGRTMILVKRSYVNNKKSYPQDPPRLDCKNTFYFGSPGGNLQSFGPPGMIGPHRKIDCEAFVVNTRGDGLCLGGPAGAPVPLPIAANASATAGSTPAGTIALTAGSTTVTGTGTAFNSGMIGQHIRDGLGRWFTVTAVASGTSLTVNQAPATANTAANPNWRLATTAQIGTFRTPTGFSHLHPMTHTEAVAGSPSRNTKCTTSGCNTDPWMIYLPP